MESTDDAALEDRPEAFNRIGVNSANSILLAVVIDRLLIVFGQPIIDVAFIGGEQANFFGRHFADERLRGLAGERV